MIDRIVGKYLGEKTDVSKLPVSVQHQIKIARKTLRMPSAMSGVMGGMNKEKAKEILKKHGLDE